MLKQTSSLLGALLLLGLSACNDENPWLGDAGTGAIRLNLTADGNVKDAIPQTRAEGNGLFAVPGASEFNIRLEKKDGTWSKSYLHDDFLNEGGFATGSYTLTAYAGDPQAEGFDCPYFEGAADVTVLEAHETEVLVHAKVANSLLSISYTEAFQNYMKDYSAEVHSAGGSYLPVASDETRPVFFKPGDVSLAVTFTNRQGQTITVQPAEFTAEAGHHYHITFNVNGGEVGVAQLEVIFDDTIDEEKVVIDLTDELFTSPAPTVTLSGIDAAEGETPELEFLAGEAPEDQYRFNVISYGGLKSVTLTLKSDSYNPPFGNEIDLIGASEAVQAQLKSIGIDCRGVFRNPDKMAFIDFSALPKNLPAGHHEISVIAKDMLTRTSEAVSVRINSVAPTVTVTPESAIFGTNQGSLLVNYNGSHPADAITFEAMNRYGVYVEAPVLNAVESQRTRSIEGKNYVFTIQLPDMEQNPVKVKVYLYGNYVTTVDLDVETPEYSVETDAFSRKVMIKVNASADQLAVITNNLKIYNGGSQVAEERLERNGDLGIITISGLSQAQAYNMVVSLRNATTEAKPLAFQTETEFDVDNGTFEAIDEKTINITNVNVGGKYLYRLVLPATYQYTASIVRDTPTGWGNINAETCYTGSSNKNTWYLVPSTYAEDGSVVVRTVGYNHAGKDIPTYETVVFKYWCQNHPELSDLNVKAGELFLGSNAEAGVEFKSRPSSVTFDCNYKPVVDGDTGIAEVSVYSGSTLIASGSTLIASGSASGRVDLEYGLANFGKTATAIAIRFRSSSASTPQIHIPTGDELDEDSNVAPLTKNLGVNNYHAFAMGSELTVDNVKLNY